MDTRPPGARIPLLKGLAKHGWKAGLGACAWLAVVASPVAAGDTMDQSQTSGNTVQQFPAMAQTFKAGMTGMLDRVDLDTATTPWGVDATVSIQTLDTSLQPSGTVKGSVPYRGTLNRNLNYQSFQFGSGASVVAGTSYAIVMKISLSSGFQPYWWANFNDRFDYKDGQMLVSNGRGWTTTGKDFNFKTFVATDTNSPPRLDVDNPALTPKEGSLATNGGGYSDPDSDAVTITPTSGTITQTATRWWWSQTVGDEGPTTYVTLTADDHHGHQVQRTFSVTVQPDPPTASITAPAKAVEGTPVTITASAHSNSPEDQAAGFRFDWTLTKDGNPYPSTVDGAKLTFTPDDEGSFLATVTATEADGKLTSAPAAATIAGDNAKPVVFITTVTTADPLVSTVQEPFTFYGSFIDPGVLDTHTVTWDFGDGMTSTTPYEAGGSASFTVTHQYKTAGKYTVGLEVKDDDGGEGYATWTLIVQTPAQALDSLSGFIQTRPDLNNGQKNSLQTKLRAAASSLQRGDTRPACNQMNAFLNEVEAQFKAGRLTSSDLTILNGAAATTQRAMGCFNNVFDFLSGI